MVWPNDDLFEFDVERELLTMEAVPLYGFGELPDASTSVRPVVTLISPPEGTMLHATDAVVFDVTDDGPFALLAFRVRFLSTDEREAAYDRDDPAGAWDPRYRSSTIETLGANHYRITLRRTGGWPPGRVGLLPRAVDAVGLVAT